MEDKICLVIYCNFMRQAFQTTTIMVEEVSIVFRILVIKVKKKRYKVLRATGIIYGVITLSNSITVN